MVAPASNSGGIGGSSSAVYQLVRVEGDGTLVPATNDEIIMEVEDVLETDKGLSNSENIKLGSRWLDAGFEEQRLLFSCESYGHSPKLMDVDGQSSDSPNPSQACNDKLQPDNTCVQTVPNSPNLNGSHSARSGIIDKISNHANEVVTSGSSGSETSKNSQPDFSLLEGEICLDDLSIKELQESFRAAFGRQTSVKDKLWLKRRIAMGLTNSCEIPSTRFIIKENKIIHNEVKEASSTVNMSETTFLSSDQVTALLNDNRQDSPTNIDHLVVSGKRLTKPVMEYDTKDENLQTEHCFGKRVRKPTRRYIEELSDVDSRECTSRSISCNNAGVGQSLKSQIRSVSDIGSWGTTFVMRQHSLGGSSVQIPYASRLRRGRPRKNFIAFTNFINMGSGKGDVETLNSEEIDMDHGKVESAGDKSDNSAETASTLNVCAKRKHHRAWTLSEVLKLVEGVARYGAGRWSEIRRVSFASYSYRTSVDLKDKWRNLLRSSFAQGSVQKSARSSRNHTSIPIPRSILLRVRELAAMQSPSAVEFDHTRYSVFSERTVQERSGFL